MFRLSQSLGLAHCKALLSCPTAAATMPSLCRSRSLAYLRAPFCPIPIMRAWLPTAALTTSTQQTPRAFAQDLFSNYARQK